MLGIIFISTSDKFACTILEMPTPNWANGPGSHPALKLMIFLWLCAGSGNKNGPKTISNIPKIPITHFFFIKLPSFKIKGFWNY